MLETGSLRNKLDYLVQTTGQKESELLVEALQEGLNRLYQKHLADDYLAGKINRAEALVELGADMVEDLDYARRSIRHDIEWGLGSDRKSDL